MGIYDVLGQKLAKVFRKGPDSKYFSVVDHTVSCNNSILLL